MIFIRFLSLAVWLLVPLAAGASPVNALKLLDAPVDFRADYSLLSAGRTYQGIVVHAPGRERREFAIGGQTEILLLRSDSDEAAILWPKRHFFVSTSFHTLAGLAGGLDQVALDRRPAGHEVVEGEATTRYLVNGAFTGQIWMTADGILMRAVGSVTFQGRKTEIDLRTSGLVREKADPALFQKPADYFGIPLDPGTFKLK